MPQVVVHAAQGADDVGPGPVEPPDGLDEGPIGSREPGELLRVRGKLDAVAVVGAQVHHHVVGGVARKVPKFRGHTKSFLTDPIRVGVDLLHGVADLPALMMDGGDAGHADAGPVEAQRPGGGGAVGEVPVLIHGIEMPGRVLDEVPVAAGDGIAHELHMGLVGPFHGQKLALGGEGGDAQEGLVVLRQLHDADAMGLHLRRLDQEPGLVGRGDLELAQGHGDVVQEHRKVRPGGPLRGVGVSRETLELVAAAGPEGHVQVGAPEGELHRGAGPVDIQGVIPGVQEGAAVGDEFVGKFRYGIAAHDYPPCRMASAS